MHFLVQGLKSGSHPVYVYIGHCQEVWAVLWPVTDPADYTICSSVCVCVWLDWEQFQAGDIVHIYPTVLHEKVDSTQEDMKDIKAMLETCK